MSLFSHFIRYNYLGHFVGLQLMDAGHQVLYTACKPTATSSITEETLLRIKFECCGFLNLRVLNEEHI